MMSGLNWYRDFPSPRRRPPIPRRAVNGALQGLCALTVVAMLYGAFIAKMMGKF